MNNYQLYRRLLDPRNSSRRSPETSTTSSTHPPFDQQPQPHAIVNCFRICITEDQLRLDSSEGAQIDRESSSSPPEFISSTSKPLTPDEAALDAAKVDEPLQTSIVYISETAGQNGFRLKLWVMFIILFVYLPSLLVFTRSSRILIVYNMQISFLQSIFLCKPLHS